jgi:hypothetical protein
MYGNDNILRAECYLMVVPIKTVFSGTMIATMGRAIAEVVSRWLPTAAARVLARAWQVGFVVDKVASGQVFS